ncbi:MAG: hypothetical protein ABI723_11085 [Bacteroidia bacterium]
MKLNRNIIAGFVSGYITLAIDALSLFVGYYFLAGFIYGIVFLYFNKGNHHLNTLKQVIFVIASGLIYIGAFQICQYNAGKFHFSKWLMFLIGGAIGALLLTLSSMLIFKKQIGILSIIFISALGGVLAIEFAFIKYDPEGFNYNLFGFLFAFPLWQSVTMYFLAKHFIYEVEKLKQVVSS